MPKPDMTEFDALDENAKAYVDSVAEVLYLDSEGHSEESGTRFWMDLVEDSETEDNAWRVARHRNLAMRIVRALTRHHAALRAGEGA